MIITNENYEAFENTTENSIKRNKQKDTLQERNHNLQMEIKFYLHHTLLVTDF